jgi:hypothetical protein
MSFSTRVTLQDAVPADQHYDVSRLNSTGTVRRVAGLPLDEPKELAISHNASSDGKKVASLVSFNRTIKDADEVTIGTSKVQLTLRYDTGQATEAIVQEDVAQLVELLSSANVTKLLNLEH